jgi:hypothetical protein
MGTGYTRADTGNNIADGNIINAADLDGEFDAVQAAFDASTGHTHDGTTAEGAPIAVTGPTQEYVSTATELRPKTNNTYDLGSATNQWKDLYVDGTANLDAVDIDGGNIDGTVVGATTPAAGTFTTAAATTGNITTVNATTVDTTNIEVTNLKAKDGTASATIANSTGVITVVSLVATTADINGGTIDGAIIGGSTPAAGTFTTTAATTGNITTVNATTVDTTNLEVTSLKAKDGTAAGSIADSTGVVTLASSVLTTADINGGTIDGTVIGGSSAAAGTFTTVTASGDVSVADKIIHTGDTNTAIRFPADDTVTVETAGSERMRINSTGNVGIGTSTPQAKLSVRNVSNSDSKTVDLIGQRNFTATTSGATSIIAVSNQTRGTHDFGAIRFEQNPATIDGGGALVRMYAGGASSSFPTNTEFLRATAITSANGVDNIQLSTLGSERMRITSTGNVGIGTSSPAYTLDVLGIMAAQGAYFTATTPANVGSLTSTITSRTGAGASNSALVAYHATAVAGRSIASFFSNIGTTEAKVAEINTQGGAYFAGNVGIGTSSPANKLHVNSGSTNIVAYFESSGTSPKIRVADGTNDAYVSATPTGAFFGANSNNNFNVCVTSTGNVGIGTSSPSFALDVHGLLETMRVKRVGAGSSASLIIEDGDGNQHSLQADASSDGLIYRQGETERLRITSTGNVGIGESAPDYKLDVNGTFGFTPGASVTPVDNGDVVFELTNNTTLTVKAKGSDGVVRSGTILLV